ncbi:MAG: hypothetical protein HY689_04825 [Chloroflexi bacterium]|nr:hypothetical protein [Chloroflexota bacterium]
MTERFGGHLGHSSEESFKCRNCGYTYPTEGQQERVCPECGHTCTRDSCRVYYASTEDF